jgi:hypothetical protein
MQSKQSLPGPRIPSMQATMSRPMQSSMTSPISPIHERHSQPGCKTLDITIQTDQYLFICDFAYVRLKLSFFLRNLFPNLLSSLVFSYSISLCETNSLVCTVKPELTTPSNSAFCHSDHLLIATIILKSHFEMLSFK